MPKNERKWPNLSLALAFLGVKAPIVPKEASKATLDEILEDWKTTDLKKAYRIRVKEAHPDRGGSKEEFAKVKSAYDELVKHVKLRAHTPETIRTKDPFFTTTSSRHPGNRFWKEAKTEEFPPKKLKSCTNCRTPRSFPVDISNYCIKCGACYEIMEEELVVGDAMNQAASAFSDVSQSFGGFASAFNKRGRKDDE
jgi:hypothetical protein